MDPIDARDRVRLLEALPWYVNGTLDPQERRWLLAMLDRDEWSRAQLEKELSLVRAAEARQRTTTDLGLAELLGRVGQPQRRGQTSSWLSPLWRMVESVQALVGQPRFAMAMVAIVAVQTVGLGWLASQSPEESEGVRGTAVRGPTLRLVAKPGIQEAAFRSALLASGAVLVSGPDSLGQYSARPTLEASIGEAAAALRNSGVFSEVEIVPGGRSN